MIEDARARQRRHRRIGAAAVVLAVVVIGVVIAVSTGGGGSGNPRTGPSVPGGVSKAKANTFVSLLYVCSPGNHHGPRILGCRPHQTKVEDLSLFSLTNGRRLGTVASVPQKLGTAVGVPVGAPDGRLLVSVTRSAPCTTPNAMECGDLVPDSCQNTVLNLSPGQTALTQMFTVASKWAIGPAVLNPDGSQVAYTARPCTGTTPTGGVFIRDLHTGQTHAIVNTNFCSTVGQPAWNASGTQIVFPFQASDTQPVHGGLPYGGQWYCPPYAGTAHAWRDLAIAPSTTTTSMGSLQLISADKDCGFESATYDATGIVALEGCSIPASRNHSYPYRGPAYVLQYNHENRLQARIKLPYPGLAPGLISSDPTTGKVLIAQVQSANYHPTYDIVYQLTGTQLHQIKRYAWGAEFLPVLW